MKILSLFSGAGGLDWGFEQAGFKIVKAFENWETAISTYKFNFGKSPTKADIGELTQDDLPHCDMIIGGPPCQGFSSLGKVDLDDKRNHLLLHTAELIKSVKPKFFIIENVTGLKWFAGGAFLEKVLSELRTGEMKAECIELDCSRLGVAQKRRRLLIVGGGDGYGEKLINCVKSVGQYSMSKTTIGNALSIATQDIMFNHFPETEMSDICMKIAKQIKQGQKLCDTRLGNSSVHSWDLPSVFGHTSGKEKKLLLNLAKIRRLKSYHGNRVIGDGKPVDIYHLGSVIGQSLSEATNMVQSLQNKSYVRITERNCVDLIRKFNGRFKRLDVTSVSPAVTMDFAYPRSILHPTENRALTVRECARLQSFEDSFQFLGTKTQQFKLVANAFPPRISLIIAQELKKLLNGGTSESF